MWSIFIMSGIIKARATCCSFLQSAKIQSVKAPYSAANGLGDSSNTTRVRPHEFFDHTGVISPLLANLFLHYTFDVWMQHNHPDIPFERYADDAVCHCRTEAQAQRLRQ